MSSKTSTISVIGPGALGSALIDFINKSTEPIHLQSVWGSKKFQPYNISSGKKVDLSVTFPQSLNDLGDTVFITTPDDKIKEVAQSLSLISKQFTGYRFIHCSGSFSSKALQALKVKGAQTASLHPLQTFTRGDGAYRFLNIWFTYQGDEELFSDIKDLVHFAGARVKKIDKKQKKAMHLAAVIASNYLVSLMDAVREVTEMYQIEEGVAMLEPLIDQTVRNIFDKGITHSLSGPVARGDKLTIQSHLQQIESEPDLTKLYSLLGSRAADMAQRSGRITPEDHTALLDLFSEKML